MVRPAVEWSLRHASGTAVGTCLRCLVIALSSASLHSGDHLGPGASSTIASSAHPFTYMTHHQQSGVSAHTVAHTVAQTVGCSLAPPAVLAHVVCGLGLTGLAALGTRRKTVLQVTLEALLPGR